MKQTINGIVGTIFYGVAHEAIRAQRPTYAFVPDSVLGPNETFDEGSYVVNGWASKNCGANPNAIGSHVLPDLTSPVSHGAESEPSFQEFCKMAEALF